jgi:hypothetical protein
MTVDGENSSAGGFLATLIKEIAFLTAIRSMPMCDAIPSV